MAASIDPVLAYLLDDLTALSRFGVAVELTVVVSSLVVIGTPIADSEYFALLGERFRKTVEHAFHEQSFHAETEAEKELQQGWNEDLLGSLARAREHGYRLFGEDAQQSTRERVQGRPQRLRGYPRDEPGEQAVRVHLAESIGDDALASRSYLHLRNASIQVGGEPTVTLPYWRGRLSDVSAWSLGRPEPMDN